jgi:hypothetical protein
MWQIKHLLDVETVVIYADIINYQVVIDNLVVVMISLAPLEQVPP